MIGMLNGDPSTKCGFAHAPIPRGPIIGFKPGRIVPGEIGRELGAFRKRGLSGVVADVPLLEVANTSLCQFRNKFFIRLVTTGIAALEESGFPAFRYRLFDGFANDQLEEECSCYRGRCATPDVCVWDVQNGVSWDTAII